VADKRQILDEAVQAGANLSAVARRYGITARVLFRWKQELTPSAAPVFVVVRPKKRRGNKAHAIHGRLPNDSQDRRSDRRAPPFETSLLSCHTER
jgi:transposase-like protein